MPLDWDAPVRAAWALNYKRFSMPEADQAIRTFMLKTGMPRKAVEDKIRTDDMFRWCFVKDPKKQNIYRDLAASYMKVGHNSRASICAVGANNYEIGVPEFEFSKLGWGIRVFETRRNL